MSPHHRRWRRRSFRAVIGLLLLLLALSSFPWELAGIPMQGSGTTVATSTRPLTDPLRQQGADPCGDGCLCPCCPAHLLAASDGSTLLSVWGISPQQYVAAPTCSLHLPGFSGRIFHPPQHLAALS